MIDKTKFERVVRQVDLARTMSEMSFEDVISTFDHNVFPPEETSDFMSNMLRNTEELLEILPEDKRKEAERFLEIFDKRKVSNILSEVPEVQSQGGIDQYISAVSSMGFCFSLVRSIPPKEVLFETHKIYAQIASGVDFEDLDTARIVALAKSDKFARKTCDRLVALGLANEKMPPSSLRDYMVLKIVDGESPLPKGRHSDGRARDALIYVLCRVTMEFYDLPLEKNVTSEDYSVSSIVAEIVASNGENIGPSAVRKIYSKMDKKLGSPPFEAMVPMVMTEIMH